MLEGLKAHNENGKGLLDLTDLLEKNERFNEVARKLDKAISELTAKCEDWDQVEKLGKKIDVANKCLMKLSRILDPVNYTLAGKYGHDRWGDFPKPIPGLQKIGELASIDPNSSEFVALKTELIRERNKISHSLEEVITLINNTIEKLLYLN